MIILDDSEEDKISSRTTSDTVMHPEQTILEYLNEVQSVFLSGTDRSCAPRKHKATSMYSIES